MKDIIVKQKTKAIILFFLIISLLPFWKYFIKREIPFNGNYLVSTYEPFKTDTAKKFPNGLPSKPYFDDQLRQYFPYLEFTRRSFVKGEFPAWNPYQFSGVPFAANWQTAIYFPTKILLFFMSTADYWSVTRMIPFFLCLVFSFLYFKTLKFKTISSVFGGVLYAFSGTFITYSQETIYNDYIFASLPLSLMALEKYWQAEQKRYLFVLFFALLLSILAGFIQQAFYLFSFVILYFVCKLFAQKGAVRNKQKRNMAIFATIALSVILSLPFLIPGFEFYNLSARKFADYTPQIKEYLLPYYSFFTFFFPDFLGNPGTRNWFGFNIGAYDERAVWIPSVFVVFFIYFMIDYLFGKKNESLSKFFLGSFMLTLVFIFRNPVSYYIVSMKVPVVGTAMFNRLIFLNTFSLVFLTVVGFEKVIFERIKVIKMFFALTVTAGIILTSFLYAKYFSLAPYSGELSKNLISQRNMIFPAISILFSLVIVYSYKISKKPQILSLIIALGFLQSLYFFDKYVPFSERKYFYPENPLIKYLKRESQKSACRVYFLDENLEYVFNDLATFYEIPVISGYDPLNYKKYNDLLFYLEHPKTEVNNRRYDAGLANLTINFDEKMKMFKTYDVCLVVTLAGEKKRYDPEFPDLFQKTYQYEKFEVWKRRLF